MTFRAIIFTAKGIETEAVKLQLCGPIGEEKSRRHEVFNLWNIRSFNPEGAIREDVVVALYETGRGQANAAIYCPPIVEKFQPDVVLYVGCAGGEPNATTIGDVFVATQIWPFEKAKVNFREIKSKAHPVEPDRALLDQARSSANFGRWRNRLADAPNEPAVKFAPIASGDKVIVHDQSQAWRHIKSKLDDEICAVETEGHGFIASMLPFKTFSLMVRGISDNLIGKNAHGSDTDHSNQKQATTYAAAFAVQLLLDIDYEVLRRFRNREGSASDEELVTIKFQTKLNQLSQVVLDIAKVANGEINIKRASEGSLILVLSMSSRSAALLDALHEGGHLQQFFAVKILAFASSVAKTDDKLFSSYLDVLSGRTKKVPNVVEKQFSQSDPEWAKHFTFLQEQIAQLHQSPARTEKRKATKPKSQKRVSPPKKRRPSARSNTLNEITQQFENSSHGFNYNRKRVVEATGMLPTFAANEIANATDHYVAALKSASSGSREVAIRHSLRAQRHIALATIDCITILIHFDVNVAARILESDAFYRVTGRRERIAFQCRRELLKIRNRLKELSAKIVHTSRNSKKAIKRDAILIYEFDRLAQRCDRLLSELKRLLGTKLLQAAIKSVRGEKLDNASRA